MFKDLPRSIQVSIAAKEFDVENIEDLNPAQLSSLEMLTMDELFDAFLTWNGIIGFSYTIKHAYEAIYNNKKEK